MSGFVIDPTDENVAIRPDGSIGYALRSVSHIEDPSAPTLDEFKGAKIIGYVNFNKGETK